MLNHPIKFAPYLKTVIWGGDKIAAYKDITTNLTGVGESWEISAVPGHESVVVDDDEIAGSTINELIDRYGEALLGSDVMAKNGKEFPLLIKIIDAKSDLSLQVHPDDSLAYARHNCPGKSEMWYIIDSQPLAKIYSGLSAPLSPDEYVRRVSDNTIMDVVAAHDAAPGQFYFVPAGTLHAIGAGCFLAEIQQTSDITYRVYDYDRRDADGNPRQLHTELAKDAIDYRFPYQPQPTAKAFSRTEIKAVDCEYFSTDFVKLSPDYTYRISLSGRTFAIVMVVDGSLTIRTDSGKEYSYHRGTTVLLPASMPPCSLGGRGKALVTHV